jgi:glycosyltransferase involved in cell wall biosynthesis
LRGSRLNCHNPQEVNILFWCGDFYPNMGGATSLVDDLAQAILKAGHSVTVLTRSQNGAPESEVYHNYEVIRVESPLLYEKLEWSLKLIAQSPGVLFRIWRILSSRRIDTVCIGLLDMNAWYFLFLRPILRFRLVLYLHGGETRKLPAAEPTFRDLLRASLRGADSVIAVSEDLALEATQVYPRCADKMHFIPNAIDFERIQAAQPFHHSSDFIAFVGRLVFEKDVATLIQAYGDAQKELSGVDLIIAGEGADGPMLRELAQACPHPERIVFLGSVDREKAISVMKGALFVVLPSVTEGLPIVAVESMAAGRPLIGSSISGIAAVVWDGYNGRLFPPRDIGELSSLLRKYCQDRSALGELGKAVRRTDLGRFDMRRIITRHLAEYGMIP